MEQLQKLIESKIRTLNQTQQASKAVNGEQPIKASNMFSNPIPEEQSQPLLFVQNTKNVGSMARYNDDDSYMGSKKFDGNAPNYTLTGNQVEQRTFQQENKRHGSGNFSDSDKKRSNNSDSDSDFSDSSDSEANYMDLEAQAEYDQLP